jgi:hypothetical protein
MGTDPSLPEDASNAKRDEVVLRRLQRGLRHLDVSRAERSDMKSYLSELGSEMTLDARIGLDVEAGDQADVEAAMNQHGDNSEIRTKRAAHLGLTCLVQVDPQ